MNKVFQAFLKGERIYNPDEIYEMIDDLDELPTIKSNKKLIYYNVPASFDIETTSFMNGKEKQAIMYEWTLGINGLVMIGRTWGEFESVLDIIVEKLELTEKKRLILYVHNLSFEFQFMRKHFTWANVFALSIRTPVYAVTDAGIEFRCSYILSGYSLAKLGEHLRLYPVQKLVGDLDYTLTRHSETVMTDAELSYCVNDVKVVMSYIQETIEQDGDITQIPLTKTGYVRKYCRQACLGTASKKDKLKAWKYRSIVKNLTLDPEEYKQLKRAFQGGFTHANAFASGKILENITSYDFTSSYPAVMIAEKFPMSKSETVEIKSKEQLQRNLDLYCCLFDVEIENLGSRLWFENYISISRCWNVSDAVVNNGRVVSASKLSTTLTEQDYLIIKKFYTWTNIRITNFRRYKRGYLPTDFVKAILKLYADKTTLKGVSGAEVEYMKSKEMLNSCYGMCVTDIVRDEIIYTDDWEDKPVNVADEIKHYNESWGRFLYYPWGVWVTAYARRNLFSGILACGEDYIYSDTDSIKIKNAGMHAEYIKKYNEQIKKDLYRACEWHGVSTDAVEPETIDGRKKLLGVWDFDGYYTRYKTLGAKRYLTELADGTVNITVSGLNKNVTVPYLLANAEDDIFEIFSDNLYIPAGYTGKLTHTYLDEEQVGQLTDYLGKTATYHELSSVHLSPSDYSMSISREYADYLAGIEYTAID